MLRCLRSVSFLAATGGLAGSSLVLAVATSGSCSLLVETASEQCQSDGDCARFPDAACDPGLHVCVARSGAGGAGGAGGTSGAGGGSCDAGGGSCDAGDGCYAGAPATNAQLLNACTTATCVPFDNKTRLTRLTADGGLPPLP